MRRWYLSKELKDVRWLAKRLSGVEYTGGGNCPEVPGLSWEQPGPAWLEYEQAQVGDKSREVTGTRKIL